MSRGELGYHMFRATFLAIVAVILGSFAGTAVAVAGFGILFIITT